MGPLCCWVLDFTWWSLDVGSSPRPLFTHPPICQQHKGNTSSLSPVVYLPQQAQRTAIATASTQATAAAQLAATNAALAGARGELAQLDELLAGRRSEAASVELRLAEAGAAAAAAAGKSAAADVATSQAAQRVARLNAEEKVRACAGVQDHMYARSHVR